MYSKRVCRKKCLDIKTSLDTVYWILINLLEAKAHKHLVLAPWPMKTNQMLVSLQLLAGLQGFVWKPITHFIK